MLRQVAHGLVVLRRDRILQPQQVEVLEGQAGHEIARLALQPLLRLDELCGPDDLDGRGLMMGVLDQGDASHDGRGVQYHSGRLTQRLFVVTHHIVIVGKTTMPDRPGIFGVQFDGSSKEDG